MPSEQPLFLSAPDVGPAEREALLAAFDSGWIAPVGPELAAFESEMVNRLGGDLHAVALSSGTAALHLALMLHGVGPGDDVLVPSLTFAATAFAVTYVGARPCFVDSDRSSWTIDIDLVAADLEQRAARDELPAAVVPVDLYGQCADHETLGGLCARYDVPVIVDAAEALGAQRSGVAAGATGLTSVLSFNGNKIVTTSGGGMLVGADAAMIERARYLATQARQPALHYEHTDIGFNYRMSNLLAAVGRAQLGRLDAIIDRRRAIGRRYRDALRSIDGVGWMPVPADSGPNHWLTVLTLDSTRMTPAGLCDALITAGIEARPAWKPMHQQPVFADHPMVGRAVADEVFATGVCLPSGSSLTDADVDRVVDAVVSQLA